MGILALTGSIIAGPPGSGLGNFPASQFQDALLLGCAGSQGKSYTYSSDSTSRQVNSPSSFSPIQGIGAGADVQRADTLYLKSNAPLTLQLTQDDGTGRVIGPVGGGIAGTASGVGGQVKVTTTTPHGLQPGDLVTLANLGGTVEANGTFPVVSNADFGSMTFDVPVPWVHAWTSGGAVSYDALQEYLRVNGLVLLEFSEQNALIALAVMGVAQVTFFACGLS